MRNLISLFILLLTSAEMVSAQSSLLEGVKNNPKEAKQLCKEFRGLNSRGISVGSDKSIEKIAKRKGLSKTDAEILSIYVIGLHCPEVN